MRNGWTRYGVWSLRAIVCGLGLASGLSLLPAAEHTSLGDEIAKIFGKEKFYEPEGFGPADRCRRACR